MLHFLDPSHARTHVKSHHALSESWPHVLRRDVTLFRLRNLGGAFGSAAGPRHRQAVWAVAVVAVWRGGSGEDDKDVL